MDYVREELLRQNRVLEALMRSGAEREQEPEQEEPEALSLGKVRLDRAAAPAKQEETDGVTRLPKHGGSAAAERRGREVWAGFAGEAAERTAFSERGAPVLRPGEGVREVSRAIERDARRYDGGFTMY